jgi:hypothetical protein
VWLIDGEISIPIEVLKGSVEIPRFAELLKDK